MSGRSVITDDEYFEDDLELEDEDYLDEDDSETEQDTSPEEDTADNAAPVSDPWENRFKGLQGSLQQTVEENKALKAQMLIFAASQRAQQLVASGVDENMARATVAAELQQVILQDEHNKINTQTQAVEESARILHARALAIEHGIAPDSKEFTRLVQFKDPDDMTEYAVVLSRKTAAAGKTVAKKQRQRTGSDRFGSANPVGRPKREAAKSLSEAADKIHESEDNNIGGLF